MSSAVQRDPSIKKWRVSVNEMHLATSLCPATIYALIHKDLHMKQDCALWHSRDLKTEQKQKGAELSKDAPSSQKGARRILRQTIFR
jgi:hypothetical protein